MTRISRCVNGLDAENHYGTIETDANCWNLFSALAAFRRDQEASRLSRDPGSSVERKV